MQSGRATPFWILEYDSDAQRSPEPLMGWTQSDDTLHQVKMKFDSLQKAQKYAEEKGLKYTVLPAHIKRVKPRNYGDNFKYIPPAED